VPSAFTRPSRGGAGRGLSSPVADTGAATAADAAEGVAASGETVAIVGEGAADSEGGLADDGAGVPPVLAQPANARLRSERAASEVTTLWDDMGHLGPRGPATGVPDEPVVAV
jgi:hypothetical protein